MADDDDETDLPDFLLPDDSPGRGGRGGGGGGVGGVGGGGVGGVGGVGGGGKRPPPAFFRTGAAPTIIKASLKDYHGLEGVRPLRAFMIDADFFFVVLFLFCFVVFVWFRFPATVSRSRPLPTDRATKKKNLPKRKKKGTQMWVWFYGSRDNESLVIDGKRMVSLSG